MYRTEFFPYNNLRAQTLDLVSTVLTDNPLHIKRIKAMYDASEILIQQQGYADIGAITNPSVLLCGTGSPTTTTEYMKHIRRLNANTCVYVADLSPDTLEKSQIATKDDQDVYFCQLNALSMPFEDNTFHRIETDRFIQFFNTTQKKELFSEWHRILCPGGVITTRDHLITDNNTLETYLDRSFKIGLKNLGLQTYTCHTDKVSIMLEELGFDYKIQNMTLKSAFNLSIPLINHIVAEKQ